VTQLAFDTIPKKPCALTTIGEFAEDGSRLYHAECACGWEGPKVGSGPNAAGTWMEHDGILRTSDHPSKEEA
jgi:hypothetical protein